MKDLNERPKKLLILTVAVYITFIVGILLFIFMNDAVDYNSREVEIELLEETGKNEWRARLNFKDAKTYIHSNQVLKLVLNGSEHYAPYEVLKTSKSSAEILITVPHQSLERERILRALVYVPTNTNQPLYKALFSLGN